MRFLLFSALLVFSRPDLCSGFLSTNLRVAKGFPSHSIQSSAPDSNADFDETTATTTTASTTTTAEERFVDAVPTVSSVTDPEAVRLREELVSLSDTTNRGFSATNSQKKRAKEIIFQLAKFNPTSDPAAPYYTQNINSITGVSLAGKWDLMYTDAPDITSLDTSRNPLATAQLGRIGQECTPPLIKNVIEWKKPAWIDQLPLPLTGDSESRVLQKVCTQATASPDQPMVVDLKLVGIDLVAPPSSFNTNNSNSGGNNNKLQEDIERDGLPVGFLKNNPLELRGPLTAPFGQFEVLYLDEEIRIILTRGYVAVNRRCQEEWF